MYMRAYLHDVYAEILRRTCRGTYYWRYDKRGTLLLWTIQQAAKYRYNLADYERQKLTWDKIMMAELARTK